jgi:hypothetical protein
MYKPSNYDASVGVDVGSGKRLSENVDYTDACE